MTKDDIIDIIEKYKDLHDGTHLAAEEIYQSNQIDIHSTHMMQFEPSNIPEGECKICGKPGTCWFPQEEGAPHTCDEHDPLERGKKK